MVELRTALSARRVGRGRVAAAAGLIALAGCAGLEGLAKFSAVDGPADLSASADAAGGGAPGSSGDPTQNSPPPIEAGALPPDAGLHDGGGGDGPDAVPEAAPPAGTDLALGAAVHATSTTQGAPANVVDGALQTSWTGPACAGSNVDVGFTCGQPLTLDLRLNGQPTVNRVVIHSGITVAEKTAGVVVTGTLVVDGGTTYSAPIAFSPTGVADVTFPAVAAVIGVRFDILTTATANPIVTEVEVFGP